MILDKTVSIKYLFLLVFITACNMNVSKKSKEIITNNDDKNFNVFFNKFSRDSIFQLNRVNFPLKYIYFDDEDRTEKSELLEKEKWFYINFSEDVEASKNEVDAFEIKIDKKDNKVEYIRKGIDNGIDVKFTFEYLKTGKWYLTQVSDFST